MGSTQVGMKSNERIIETLWKGNKLTEYVPANQERALDLLTGLMRVQDNKPRYLVHGGKLVGLNLAYTGLTDLQWQDISQSPDFCPAELQALNLCGNELTSFSMENFTSLKLLDLSENGKLDKILFPVRGDLEHLDINACTLSVLEVPQGLPKLQRLNARDSKLQMVQFEGNLPALEYLDLRNNVLSSVFIPEGFQKLAYLNLDQNPIQNLAIANPLKSLRSLYMRAGNLEQLPSGLSEYVSLNALYIYGNPLGRDLPEAVLPHKKEDNSAKPILDYLRELQKGTIVNDRVKIITVGNGRVGKTSFLKRLRGMVFDPEEHYTHGIQIGNLDKKDYLPGVKTNTINASIWDFGGQEIFYATHQFFLTEEALYILVWTDEANVEPYRIRDKESLPFDKKWHPVEYWLESVRLHGKESPILMVQSHVDKKRSEPDINCSQKPYNAVCLDFNAEDPSDWLPLIRRRMAEKINDEIPFFARDFPKTYQDLIRLVENERAKKPFISMENFYSLCRAAKIDPGGEDSALDYLRRIGTVVYITNNTKLKHVVYIDPNWLTQNVYRLIKNELRTKEGVISESYLKAELGEAFDDTSREQFIELLKSFELIFQPEEDKKEYIAPQYLPEKLPVVYERVFQNHLKHLELGFVFRFPKFVPDNVMINFLSRYGPFSAQLKWKNGIYFCWSTHTSSAPDQDEAVECAVIFDPGQKSLQVHISKSKGSCALQKEVCEAFVELSKNANAEISKDGRVFVNWQTLKKEHELGNANILATDGKTPVPVNDFKCCFELSKDEKTRIFISYAHGDEGYRNNIVSHLSALKNQEMIEVWHDRQIIAGQWDPQIKKAMEEADLFLFLITPKFLASRYIGEIEIITAYKKFKEGKAKIMPVLCEFCDWERQPVSKNEKIFDPTEEQEVFPCFKMFMYYPTNKVPIEKWPTPNEGYMDVILGIRKELKKPKK